MTGSDAVPSTGQTTSIGARRRWALVVVAAAAVVALDQLTKAWAVDRLRGRTPIDVVWTLRFSYAENTGMAFSRASGAGPVIAVVAVVIVVVVALSARRMRSPWMLVLSGVVIGGALGNVLDRLLRVPAGGRALSGPVVDFIDLQWWPVFNVADAAIVVGGIALAVASFREPVDDEPDGRPTESGEPAPDPSTDAPGAQVDDERS